MCFDKAGDGLGFESKKVSEKNKKIERSGIYCKFCHAQITHPSQAIEVQGGFLHKFNNPEGLTFTIGLYGQADCLGASPFVNEYTWFNGYAWQIAVCPQCKSHIGWSYSKTDSPDFYGLILNRLLIVDK